MKTNVYIYRKNNVPLEIFQDSLKSVLQSPEDTFKLYTESNRGYMALHKLEKEAEKGSVWIIESVSSLGNTIGDIRDELHHLAGNEIILLIANYPSMKIYHNEVMSQMALTLLCDVYDDLHGEKVESLSAHPLKAGRKKATYPEGWEELYAAWENKEITSTEFLRRSGMKKATFYNLLGEYRLKSASFSRTCHLKDALK